MVFNTVNLSTLEKHACYIDVLHVLMYINDIFQEMAWKSFIILNMVMLTRRMHCEPLNNSYS